MFLCEFAKDLQIRLSGRGIFFRAVLVLGQFTHYELNGMPCFFGTSLVRACRAEKTLQAIGLFMDRSLVLDSDIFKSVPFDDVYDFVFITQGLNMLEDLWGGVIDRFELEETDLIYLLVPELLHLRELSHFAASHEVERVRQKHSNTLKMFRTRYPRTLGLLEANNFEFSVLCPDAKWSEVVARYPESYSFAIERRDIY